MKQFQQEGLRGALPHSKLKFQPPGSELASTPPQNILKKY